MADYPEEFVLQPELYLYGSRLVKIYSPIIILGRKEFFWVYCLDDKDVIVVEANKLKLAPKSAKILFE